MSARATRSKKHLAVVLITISRMKTNWRGSIGAETDVSDARLEEGMKLMSVQKARCETSC